MDTSLKRTWRRGAVALALPATCLFLVALNHVGEATARALWYSRASGIVTTLTYSKKAGYRPTIEYPVGKDVFNIQTASHYSEHAFAVGQKVTVLYPAKQPQLGMLDGFVEQWRSPVFLSIGSLLLVGLAWKGMSGLSALLHALWI